MDMDRVPTWTSIPSHNRVSVYDFSYLVSLNHEIWKEVYRQLTSWLASYSSSLRCVYALAAHQFSSSLLWFLLGGQLQLLIIDIRIAHWAENWVVVED